MLRKKEILILVLKTNSGSDLYSVCQGILDPFYIMSYYMKWFKTSWTYNILIRIPDQLKKQYYSANFFKALSWKIILIVIFFYGQIKNPGLAMNSQFLKIKTKWFYTTMGSTRSKSAKELYKMGQDFLDIQ